MALHERERPRKRQVTPRPITTETAHAPLTLLVLLHGLTGPVDGKTYVTQMVPMATNSDHWIASVLSYIRNSFGNEAPFITAKDVARVRAK